MTYYRVSTAQQGQSGVGLDTQREAVMRYLSNGAWPPLAEFTEVETGKGTNALDRPPNYRPRLPSPGNTKPRGHRQAGPAGA